MEKDHHLPTLLNDSHISFKIWPVVFMHQSFALFHYYDPCSSACHPVPLQSRLVCEEQQKKNYNNTSSCLCRTVSPPCPSLPQEIPPSYFCANQLYPMWLFTEYTPRPCNILQLKIWICSWFGFFISSPLYAWNHSSVSQSCFCLPAGWLTF